MDFLETVVLSTTLGLIIVVICLISWIRAQPHICQDRSVETSFDVGTIICPPCLRAFLLEQLTGEVASMTFRYFIGVFLIRAFYGAYYNDQCVVNSIRLAFYSFVISVMIQSNRSRVLNFLHLWGPFICGCGFFLVYTLLECLNVYFTITVVAVCVLVVLLAVNSFWITRLFDFQIDETCDPTIAQG